MRLNEIVRKVASNLMPPGTVIERMVESPFLSTGDKITVNSNDCGLIDYMFLPEYFRVVKEAK